MNSQDQDANIDEIERLEEEQLFEDNLNELPPNDIVAFNELRSCADLLRMYDSKQLDIQPDFQRDVVWSKPDQTRFIDSLIKQLPIPSMCISLDYKTDKRQIIDGLQRMTSIINFLSNDEWKLSQLEDINEDLSGKTVHTIKTKYKELYARVQNVVIPITVIRCDYSKESHSEYLFTIFHRLNSGGMRLNNQEIRNCIFNGNFNSLLKDLASSELTSITIGKKTRFANEELLLRFFAFNEILSSYSGKLSTFLNSYMRSKRDLNDKEILDKQLLANRTLNIIYEKIFNSQPIKGIGKTVLEGLMYGISQNIDYLEKKSEKEVQSLYQQFLHLKEYSIVSLKEGLAQKDKLISRLNASKQIFAK